MNMKLKSNKFGKLDLGRYVRVCEFWLLSVLMPESEHQ